MIIKFRNLQKEIQVELGRNIVVLANYRTGSTALCDLLARRTDYKNLDEAFHFKHKDRDYQNLKTITGPCVIKIMPEQFVDFDFVGKIFADAIFIGIYRKNFVDQVASFYQAHCQEHWHLERGNSVQSTCLSIDRQLLKIWGRRLASNQKDYVKCREFMQDELEYGSLITDLRFSRFEILPKPTNYDELLTATKEVLLENGLPLFNE
jgi:hypothetical protein